METTETYYAAPDPNQHKRRVLVIIGGCILLVVLVALGWWLIKHRKSAAPIANDNQTSYTTILPKLSEESLKNIPEGFPRQYIFGVNPRVTTSTVSINAVNGSVSTRIIVVDDIAPQQLFSQYMDFFTHTGWQATSTVSQAGLASSITATRNLSTMIVSFVGRDRTTQMTMNVITPKQ